MPSKISQDQITKAILDGFNNAEKAYREWSGGWTLGSSAEHVVYVFIAEAICKIPGSKILKIEQSCKDVVEAACGSRRGKLAESVRIKGHIDIVLSWANDKPRAIIEIKNNVYNYEGQCKPDIERIKALLNMRDTTLSFGIFAFYSSETNGRETAKEKLEKRFNSIKSRINDDYGKFFKVSGSQKILPYTNTDNKTCAWSSSYILLKPY
jgi:hypothetical protein